MIRFITIFSSLFFLSHALFSQQWAHTIPENKHALIESFTGVECGGCPDGEAEAENLLQQYGTNLCVNAYHQPNTLFCVPYGNDEDFRRPFLAAYASPSFNFTGSYPSA